MCASVDPLSGTLSRNAFTGLFGPRAANVAYNQVPWASVHNAYAASEGILDQLERSGFRSLELDVHCGKHGRPALAGDWYVYHHDFQFLDRTRCDRLSECLDALAEFHRRDPQHAPVTVFLDLKDSFDKADTPEALDTLVSSRLPAGDVLRPADLLARCPSAHELREAVRPPCGWPRIGELRGKFVFVLTGQSACEPGGMLRSYAPDAATAASRLGFIAPSVTDDCRFAAYESRVSFAVFYNLDWAHRDAASLIRAQGAVARLYESDMWGGLDDTQLWQAFKDGLANFLVTDRLDLK